MLCAQIMLVLVVDQVISGYIQRLETKDDIMAMHKNVPCNAKMAKGDRMC